MEEVTTTVAGLTVASLTGGSGEPLVMLHHSFGNPGWMPVHESLAQNHRVHALDVPGYGKSQRPDWARHPRDLAILVGQWLRASELGPAHLVGCGFGGWLAAELATMAPERLATLTLVGAAGLVPAQGRIYDQFLVSHSDYVRAAFANAEAYRAVFGAPDDGEADALVTPEGTALTDDTLVSWDIHREMTTRVGWKPYMHNRRLRPLLAGVGTPSLVVWGDSDRVVPVECGRAYAEALPDARLEIVADCGHAVDLEAPEALTELIAGHTQSRKAG